MQWEAECRPSLLGMEDEEKIRQNTGQNASSSCARDVHPAALDFSLGSSRAPNAGAGAASAFP